MTIDVHAHLADRQLLDALAEQPGNRLLPVTREGSGYHVAGYGTLDPLLHDLEGRLASLSRRGVALQLVSPPPPLWSKPGWAPSVAEAALMNASTRRAVRAAGGALAGLAVPPLGEPEQAIAEVEDMLAGGDFAGVVLPTSVAGGALDEPVFEPFLAHLAQAGHPVFMHSVTAARRESLMRFTLNTAIGWPVETVICISRLIFSGVLERCPMKLVLSHGGGVLPWLAARLDLAWSAPQYERNPECRNIGQAPSAFLRALHDDTTVAGDPTLSWLLDFAGEDQVMFGGDFPYEIGDAEGALAMPVIDGLAPAVRDKVLRGNAARLLAIPA